MGYTARSKRRDVYGKLINIYPRTFRNYYGPTMVQTFDDMLAGEKTQMGRIKVWTRALLDLPSSAVKEHITNGKELTMNRDFKLLLAASLVAILIVGAGSFWFGNLRAHQNIGIERVTTTQLADAMQRDSFYSSYGSAALLFSGKVSHVESGNNVTLVTFETSGPYSLTCQFPTNISVKNGQTFSVAAPGGSAEREKASVLLHDCVQN